jgi:hypothetical protein
MSRERERETERRERAKRERKGIEGERAQHDGCPGNTRRVFENEFEVRMFSNTPLPGSRPETSLSESRGHVLIA